MKRFIIHMLLLLLAVFFMDQIVGYVMKKVIDDIEIGGMGRDNYICNESTEDILIFGSSRAVHHYNSKMIQDSLNVTCYNCGDDGNGVFLNYARLLMCNKRHTPKIIIFDFVPDFDIMVNDNTKYLGWLRARYNREGISEIFDDIDRTEKYKMLSHMYRYNTRFLQNLIVFMTNRASDTGILGYRSIPGNFNKLKTKNKSIDEPLQVDNIKLDYIKKFITESKGSKLFFIYSPRWYGADTVNIKPLKDLCLKENISFIDFTANPKYDHKDEYFKDGTHLNSVGADEFTKDIIVILQDYI